MDFQNPSKPIATLNVYLEDEEELKTQLVDSLEITGGIGDIEDTIHGKAYVVRVELNHTLYELYLYDEKL